MTVLQLAFDRPPTLLQTPYIPANHKLSIALRPATISAFVESGHHQNVGESWGRPRFRGISWKGKAERPHASQPLASRIGHRLHRAVACVRQGEPICQRNAGGSSRSPSPGSRTGYGRSALRGAPSASERAEIAGRFKPREIFTDPHDMNYRRLGGCRFHSRCAGEHPSPIQTRSLRISGTAQTMLQFGGRARSAPAHVYTGVRP